VPQRLQFRLADIDLERLRQIEAEVAPAHNEILRQELQKFWMLQLQNFPHPVQIVDEGKTTHNLAAVLSENLYSDRTLVDYEHEIELQKTQIKVLTEKLNELLKQQPTPEQEEEVKEASLLLALWKSFSAKPGLFGFSIDLKALIAESIAIIRSRSQLVELHLDRTPKQP